MDDLQPGSALKLLWGSQDASKLLLPKAHSQSSPKLLQRPEILLHSLHVPLAHVDPFLPLDYFSKKHIVQIKTELL